MPTHLDTYKFEDTYPFRIINKLSVPHYIEKSFKIRADGLIGHRYLVGINKKHIDKKTMVEVCQEMDMPDDLLDKFNKSKANAGWFGIGYQEKGSQKIYKVYLDFFESMRTQIRFRPDPNRPLKLNVGFKWDPANRNSKIVSTYNCYPTIKMAKIRKRVNNLYAINEDENPLAAAIEILNLANSKVEGEDYFDYLEVNDEGSLKKSFDINLLSARLKVSEIAQFIAQVFDHFLISHDQYMDFLKQIESKRLAHLAGGKDMDGNDFLTVYYRV